MHIYCDISNFFWPFRVTFIFVLILFGHGKNSAITVRLMHLHGTFDDYFESQTKGAHKKNLLTSVISLLHLYHDHVLNSFLWPNSSFIHQINRYFSCSFKKIHRSAKYDLTHNFRFTYSFFSVGLLMRQLVNSSLESFRFSEFLYFCI